MVNDYREWLLQAVQPKDLAKLGFYQGGEGVGSPRQF